MRPGRKAVEIVPQILNRPCLVPSFDPASTSAVERSFDEGKVRSASQHGAEILLGAHALGTRSQLAPDDLQFDGTAMGIERQVLEGGEGLVRTIELEQGIHTREARLAAEDTARETVKIAVERHLRGTGIVPSAQESNGLIEGDDFF